MTASFEAALLVAGILLVVSVLASKASGRLGVPALLVFVIIGMAAGSEGPGGIWFADAGLAQSLGVLALAMILFAGGLDTEWQVVRPILGVGIVLSTLGVLITCALMALFAWKVMGFSPRQAFLLGAIVSSTDAAAVFAVLRARGVGLPVRVRGLLELESGSNDPMAVFLTTAAIDLLMRPQTSWLTLAGDFVLQMAVGGLVGVLLARLAIWLINRIDLEYVGLYPVLSLAFVLVTYGAASRLQGNGFLAVYLAGLVFSQRTFLHKRKLLRFHDGLAWLMQIAMFLTLGLLVFPSALVAVWGPSLAAALFLIFVARPVAVYLGLAGASVPFREKTLIGYVGLRGAVPIILATFPLLAGVGDAGMIFNVVFFIVMTSVLIQGTTIAPVARLLKVAVPDEVESPLPRRKQSELVTLEVPAGGRAAGLKIVDLGLPADSHILLIHRSGGFFVPEGGTEIEAGDKLMTFTSKDSIDRVRGLVGIVGQEREGT